LEKVTDSCRQFGVNRILAVIDPPGRIEIWDAHKVINTPESFGWDQSFKLSLVYTHEERFESNLFSERLAVSRKFKMKIFRNRVDAKEWLLGAPIAEYS